MDAQNFTPATAVLAIDAELLARSECPLESLSLEERVALLEQRFSKLAIAHANLVRATVGAA